MKPKAKAQPWFEIRNAASEGEPTQIFIYEEISDWWGLSAKDFVQELAALDVEAIDLHINSPGGSVFDGHAIYNALRNHKATVTAYIDGVAASIASVIALAGDKVVIARNAMMMIHDPTAFVGGRAADIRKMADVLDKLRDTIAATYVVKSGKSVEEVNAAMAETTWYTADEAVEFGLADELGVEMNAAAMAAFDFEALGFMHVPEQLVALADDDEDGSDDAADGDAPGAGEGEPPAAGDTSTTMDSDKVAQALRARFEEV